MAPNKDVRHRAPKRGAYIPKQAFNDVPSGGSSFLGPKSAFGRGTKNSVSFSKKAKVGGSLTDKFYASRAGGFESTKTELRSKATSFRETGSALIRPSAQTPKSSGQTQNRTLSSNFRGFSEYEDESEGMRDYKNPSSRKPRESSRAQSHIQSDATEGSQKTNSRGSKKPTSMKKGSPRTLFSKGSDGRKATDVSSRSRGSDPRNPKPKKPILE
jgi:hypothetical protein